MKKYIFILLPCLILCFSCQGNKSFKPAEDSLDSLAAYCYSLVQELQTDTLRMASQKYLDATVPYSERFYNARQYYINSYFNARDYNKVLSLLDETEKMPHFADYPHIVCNYRYTRGRVYQFCRRYDEAIKVYKSCLEEDFKGEKGHEKYLSILLGSMTQLVNVYSLRGTREEGYRCFVSLKNYPTPFLRKYGMRDIYAHLAYISGQAGHVEESYLYADSIFKLSLHHSTSERLFRDYSYAATVFYNNPDKKDYVGYLLEQALQEAEKKDYTPGIQWCMSLLASYYRLHGKIEEGTELEFRALEKARKRGDRGGECNAYINLSDLYLGWELYKQSNEYADLAVSKIIPSDNYHYQGMAYLRKARVMRDTNLPDSAIYYFHLADSCFSLTKMESGTKEAKNGMAKLFVEKYMGDSLALGVNMLKRYLQTTGRNVDRSFSFYCLGKGLIKQGYISEGEAMLDSMYNDIKRLKGAIYSKGVLEFVLDHYLATGNCEKIKRYAAAYRRNMDVRYDENISKKVTGAMIKYQTEKKEQQLKLAMLELSMKNLRIKYYVAIVIGLALLLLVGIMWYIHQQKLYRTRLLLTEKEAQIVLKERELVEMRLHEQEEQLANALNDLREVNYQSEQLQEQLTSFLSASKNLQEAVSFTPSVLREGGEVKFRRYFSSLYPSFQSVLKERIPHITRSEEILCMLIALGQNMDEMAEILCIEKKSVKMSRYRIRKKMKIEQDESLDEIIKSML